MSLFEKLFRISPPPPAAASGDLVVDLSKVDPQVKAIFGGETPDPHPRPNPENEHMQMTFEDSPVFETWSGLLVRHIYARENNCWVLVETA
jgi:hypothetical protein